MENLTFEGNIISEFKNAVLPNYNLGKFEEEKPNESLERIDLFQEDRTVFKKCDKFNNKFISQVGKYKVGRSRDIFLVSLFLPVKLRYTILHFLLTKKLT